MMGERASPDLKLTIVRGGGLAGITRQTELASEALPPDEATKLHELIECAGLFDEDAPREAAPAHPDELSYEVIIEHEGEARTQRFTEQTLPEPVRDLIASIDSRPESRQSIVGR